jgi:uncharacterized protein (TIGR03086 family)
MQHNRYIRSLDGFEALLAGADPSRWDAPSPCPGWSARDVAGHVILGLRSTQNLALDRQGEDNFPARPGAAAGNDPLTAWLAARKHLMAALTPRALARRVPGPWGPMPLGELLDDFSMEILVHTWDLAQATGQAVTFDPDLLHEALEPAGQFAPLARLSDMVGPERTVTADAGDLTKLLAIFGRDEQTAQGQ